MHFLGTRFLTYTSHTHVLTAIPLRTDASSLVLRSKWESQLFFTGPSSCSGQHNLLKLNTPNIQVRIWLLMHSLPRILFVSDLKFSVIQDMRSLGHSHVLPQLLISILFCNHFEQISSCANIYSCNSLAFCSRARGQEPCTIHLCYERYAWICSLMSCANSFFPPLYLAIKLHI